MKTHYLVPQLREYAKQVRENNLAFEDLSNLLEESALEIENLQKQIQYFKEHFDMYDDWK